MSAQVVAATAAARHRLGLRQCAPHRGACAASTCRSPACPPALDGFTIAQISDIHVGPDDQARPTSSASSTAVNALDADLVAITGDLVDGSVRRARAARRAAGAACARATAPSSSPATTSTTRARRPGSRELRRLGLHGAAERARGAAARRRARWCVAGVTDFSAGHFDRGAAQRPARGARRRAGRRRCALLLAHQPRSAAAAEAAGFDLQLSGHTHGGQFLPWNFFVRLQQPFTAGLHRWRRMWVYTSRGTGYWGPPKRFGAPSEITLLRLVAAPARGGRAEPARALARPLPPVGSEAQAPPSTIHRFCRPRRSLIAKDRLPCSFPKLSPRPRAGRRRRPDVRRSRQHAAAGPDVRGALLRDDPAADEAAEGAPGDDRGARQGRRGRHLRRRARQGHRRWARPSSASRSPTASRSRCSARAVVQVLPKGTVK